MSIKFEEQTVLIDYIQSGDFEQTKNFLQVSSRRCINSVSPTGLSPIHYACMEGNLEIVKLLYQYNANINTQDYEGWTPLHIVTVSKNIELVNFFLDCGANLLLTNLEDETPLDIAEDAEIYDLLAEAENDYLLNQGLSSEEEIILNALKAARKENNFSTFQKNLGISENGTLLHLAAAHGFNKIVEYICTNELVDLNTKDDDGWTPMHVSCYFRNDDITDTLLVYGANSHLKTKLYNEPKDL